MLRLEFKNHKIRDYNKNKVNFFLLCILCLIILNLFELEKIDPLFYLLEITESLKFNIQFRFSIMEPILNAVFSILL